MDKIDISQNISDFKQVFRSESRLIFSAKFGDGKSYFLNEFRNSFSSTSDAYYFITLHPVNYVVEDNKDIIEYIKRDILFQLIKDDKIIDYKTSDEKFFDAVFNKESLLKLANFFSCIAPIPSLGNAIEKIRSLIECVKGIYDKYQNQNDVNFAEDYLNGFYGKKGSISECDAFTMLIQKTLDHMMQKKVLIVEDLDRIDPAHLFRIMNVLSSQVDNPYYDDCSNKNKFGFDKIILVMDYDITRHIFHHFYGINANYEGYMNKFLNTTPYRFSITQAAQMQVRQRIEQLIGTSELSEIRAELAAYPTEAQIISLEKCISLMSVRQCKEFLDTDISIHIKPHWRNPQRIISTQIPFIKLLACFKLVSSYSLLTVFSAMVEDLSGRVAIQLLLLLFFEKSMRKRFFIKDGNDRFICSYDHEKEECDIGDLQLGMYESQLSDPKNLKREVLGMKDEVLDLINGKQI